MNECKFHLAYLRVCVCVCVATAQWDADEADDVLLYAEPGTNAQRSVHTDRPWTRSPQWNDAACQDTLEGRLACHLTAVPSSSM